MKRYESGYSRRAKKSNRQRVIHKDIREKYDREMDRLAAIEYGLKKIQRQYMDIQSDYQEA